MPTYQYACTECGHQLEAVQSFTDSALTQCPACDGKLRKLFSAVGIVFKGSGFYRTDSRPNGSGDSGGSTSPATSESAKTGDSGASSSAATTGSGSSSSKDAGQSSGSGSGSGSGASSPTSSSKKTAGVAA